MSEQSLNEIYSSYEKIKETITPQDFLHRINFYNKNISDVKKVTYKFYDCLISIVVPFIEKHFETAVNLLKSLPNNIPEKYEVIVINNSGSYKDIESFKNAGAPTDNLTVLNNDGKNLLPFNSRRLGSINAKGKWIWYVDADDKVSKVPNNIINVLFNDNSDIIRFSERLIQNDKLFNLPGFEFSVFDDSIKNKELTVQSANYCLHPIIINKDFYMSHVYEGIKDVDVNFFYGEDTLLLRYIVTKYRTIKDVDGTLYSYDFDKGESHSVIRTVDSIRTIINDFPTISKIYGQVFTKEQLAEFEMDNYSYKNVILFYIDDLVYHLEKEHNPNYNSMEVKSSLTKELMRVILLNNMNDALDERSHIHNS